MTFLRQWLLGIVSCALLVSFCEQLTPSGALKKLVRFTGGLLLILSILQPVTRLNLDILPLDLDAYREAMAQAHITLEDERSSALADCSTAALPTCSPTRVQTPTLPFSSRWRSRGTPCWA